MARRSLSSADRSFGFLFLIWEIVCLSLAARSLDCWFLRVRRSITGSAFGFGDIISLEVIPCGIGCRA